ncbi:MAG: CHASE2 domain-containing protein [Magnetococcales bacterium]|nr:CHASE2 domain-containing protein [Magnetococcales bacterium]
MTRFPLRNHHALVLALVGLFMLCDHTAPIRTLEHWAYDRGLRAITRDSENRVVLVTLDDPTLDRLGGWPLAPRHFTRLVEILHRGTPRVIGFTFPIPVDTSEAIALGTAFHLSGQVVMGMSGTQGTAPTTPAPPDPDPAFLTASALPAPLDPIPEGSGLITLNTLQAPREELGFNAARLGVDLLPPDPDDVVRSLPLMIRFHDTLYPTLALAIAIEARSSPPKNLLPHADGRLQLNEILLPTRDHGWLNPYFHPGVNRQPEFATYSMLSILDGNVPPDRFRDRVVMIGPTASRLARQLPTPTGRDMSPLEIHAQGVASLLDDQGFRIPPWGVWIRYGLYGVVGILLFFAPPGGVGARLATLVITVLLGLLVPIAHVWLLDTLGLWVPMAGPLAMLTLGFFLPLLVSKRFRFLNQSATQPRDRETRLALILAYQGQHCWDLAMETFCLCPMDPMLMTIARHLGQELETAQRFADAILVYQRMSRFDPQDPEPAKRLRHLQARLRSTRAPHLPHSAPLEHPLRRVGDHGILAELAQDALGTLLLGQDPASGQGVILRLPGPNLHRDPREAEQARQAFLADGERWLRIQHDGVVTLLAIQLEEHPPHLVMEHFPISGNLERHVHPDDPLPLTLILYIITRAALILDHVHQRGLTHGNLRPEDLIYDPKTRRVWIKEFGLARLLGADPAGTGISPYAPPESLTPGAPDPRSDLYALGAISFHLLTGHPPFKTDDPETLRSRILSTAPQSIPLLRPEIHPDLARIVEKSLARNPAHRHPRGADLARELVRYIRAQVRA